MIFNVLKHRRSGSGIYMITNSVNAKIYVGSAINLRDRFSTHRYTLNKGIHKSPQLQAFTNKYGIDTLKFNAIAFCGKEDLLKWEQFYLDALDPFGKNGFNTLRVAGSALGLTHSEETKLKVSRAHKGRKHTEESRKNMSEGQRNRTWSLSESGLLARKKTSTGRIISEETKLKISKSHSGRVHTEQSRKNMSESHKGKILSASQKKNQSAEMLLRNPFGKLVLNTETGIYYNSGIQAAKAHGIHPVSLNEKLRGAKRNNTVFILA